MMACCGRPEEMVSMSSTLSLTQSDPADLRFIKPPVGTIPHSADPKNHPISSKQPSLGKRAWRALARFLITFCIAVAGTLAWQSYGVTARQKIASLFPRLDWLAPQAAPVAQTTPEMIVPAAPAAPSFDQKQLSAMSLDLSAVRQTVDLLAASHEQTMRSVGQIAGGQEQMTRTVDQLAASQGQMTRDITKLQAAEQNILRKIVSTPPLRPSVAPAQARAADARAGAANQ